MGSGWYCPHNVGASAFTALATSTKCVAETLLCINSTTALTSASKISSIPTL